MDEVTMDLEKQFLNFTDSTKSLFSIATTDEGLNKGGIDSEAIM